MNASTPRPPFAPRDLPLTRIDGSPTSLDEFSGKALLIVNTASQCGFTRQYAGLEALYQKYRDQGLVVLGFPCNQFGEQEPDSEASIAAFCDSQFRVSFPMFSKVQVNGPDAHPLFARLKRQAPGLLGTQGVKWNFTKFLVSRNGLTVRRFAPWTRPESLRSAVEKALAD